MTVLLIAADAGNRKMKYKLAADKWVAEDALVRLPTQVNEDLRSGRIPTLTYLEGPAEIDKDTATGKLRRSKWLVGPDAVRGGSLDVSRVGTAAVRVNSDPYKLQHMYMLARSLPRSITHEIPAGKKAARQKPVVEAEILFAGGLPGDSTAYKPELLAWLKGDGRGPKERVHRFEWDGSEYRLTVTGGLIIAQHIAVGCSLSFSDGGAPLANGALNRKRLVLDPGGGTTDYGGSIGLEVIPGTEGSVRKAAQEIASTAREFIQANHKGLQISVLDVLNAMDMAEPTVWKGGEPVSVRAELAQAAELVANAILAETTPRWEDHLSQAEVVIAGGTGQWIYPTVRREYRDVKVSLLDEAIFRVGYGIERLAKNRLKARLS